MLMEKSLTWLCFSNSTNQHASCFRFILFQELYRQHILYYNEDAPLTTYPLRRTSSTSTSSDQSVFNNNHFFKIEVTPSIKCKVMTNVLRSARIHYNFLLKSWRWFASSPSTGSSKKMYSLVRKRQDNLHNAFISC